MPLTTSIMVKDTTATSTRMVSTGITIIATSTRAARWSMPTPPTIPCMPITLSITNITWGA